MSASTNYLEKNSSFGIEQNYWEHLQCALAWDFETGKSVDLDASAVLFDNYGHFYDVAYFNQLQTLDGGVIHSGDNTTGKGDGDDELITFHLSKLPPKVKAVAITVTCYKTGDFTAVQQATAQLRWKGSDLITCKVGCQGTSTGLILCVLFRTEKSWSIVNAGISAEGRNFKELQPKIYEFLKSSSIISADMVILGTDWDPNGNKSFSLEKGNRIMLPLLDQVTVGIGWDESDTSKKADLDVNCVIFESGALKETVFFQNAKSKDGAIIFEGDNQTGKGEGDDERIAVHLNKINAKTTLLAFAVTIYSDKISFADIKNAYVRIIDTKSGNEFCKYTLTSFGQKNALIMCRIFRDSVREGGWILHTIGELNEGQSVQSIMPTIVKSYGRIPHPDLDITIVEGKNLIAKDSNGASDPYVMISETDFKTKVVKKSLQRQWNESFTSYCFPYKNLTFTVWDQDLIKDDFMGVGVLPMDQIILGSVTRIDTWVDLKPRDAKDQVSGSIRVIVRVAQNN